MIALDMQPTLMVEDHGFLNFVKVADPKYKPPSRRTVVEDLEKMYEKTTGSLKVFLKQQPYCAFTTDIWTSSTAEGYLTFTCHYINELFDLQAYILETTLLKESHTGEHIKEELVRIAKEWGINDNIVCSTTDNGNNVVCAMRLTTWKHLPYFAHTLNLIVQLSIEGTLKELKK